jgi:hypothetical protein
MSNGIAGIITEIKYARSDRKHNRHLSGESVKFTVKRYNRAVRKMGRRIIEDQIHEG